MPIIRWKPLAELDDLFEHFHEKNDLMVDLYDENGAIVVEMAVAGIDPDKVDIAIEGTALRISGSREKIEESEDKNYYQKEIKRGSFERLVHLPSEVDSAKARADFKDGILRIYLPKKVAEQASKVKVQRK